MALTAAGNVKCAGAFYGQGDSNFPAPTGYRPVPFTNPSSLDNLVTVSGNDVTFPGKIIAIDTIRSNSGMGVGISDAEANQVITMYMPISLANNSQTSAGNSGHYYLSYNWEDDKASDTNHYASVCANDDCLGEFDPRFQIVPSLFPWSY